MNKYHQKPKLYLTLILITSCHHYHHFKDNMHCQEPYKYLLQWPQNLSLSHTLILKKKLWPLNIWFDLQNKVCTLPIQLFSFKSSPFPRQCLIPSAKSAFHTTFSTTTTTTTTTTTSLQSSSVPATSNCLFSSSDI